MRELSLHVLDLMQNSVEAGASRVRVTVIEDESSDLLQIEVEDDGQGMSPDMAQRALDPFVTTRTTRKVGLGLPLLKAAAERCEGGVEIRSKEGEGTAVLAQFRHSHIDRAPLGDMAATLQAFIAGVPQIDLEYRHRRVMKDGTVIEIAFETAEVRARLGEVPLNHPMVVDWIGGFLAEQFDTLDGPGGRAGE